MGKKEIDGGRREVIGEVDEVARGYLVIDMQFFILFLLGCSFRLFFIF